MSQLTFPGWVKQHPIPFRIIMVVVVIASELEQVTVVPFTLAMTFSVMISVVRGEVEVTDAR